MARFVHFNCFILAFCATALFSTISAVFITDDRFMSDVNLEHYYVIEENALSNADVLLREDYFGADEEEEEEEHLAHAPNLTSFKSVIDETKTVHRLAGPDLEAFLAHPINVYHLFRRLDTGWRDGIDLLLQTKPCKEWNLPSMVGRLRYLQENLPGREEVERVVEYIALVQKLHRLKAREIAKGKIEGSVSVKPLSIDELFDIVKVLHDKDDMKTALEWLELIYELVTKLSPAQKEGLDFNVTDVLNMLASAYYQLRNVSKAMEATEKVLRIDPDNLVAKSNQLFFRNKMANEKEKDNIQKKKATPPEQLTKYERLCRRTRPKKISRKKCQLVRVGLMFYKMEQIRHKPYVVLFHDVIQNTTSDTIRSYAHEMQTEQAWVMEDTFHPPDFNVKLDVTKLKKRLIKREIRRLLRHILSLSVAVESKPYKWRKLQIINVGLEGMHLKNHRVKLDLIPLGPKESGSFLTFLNEVKKGGEVILTENSIKLRPEKGSILFYYPTMTTPNSFCPVLGSSLWVAVQTMYEKRKTYCVDEDEWL